MGPESNVVKYHLVIIYTEYQGIEQNKIFGFSK